MVYQVEELPLDGGAARFPFREFVIWHCYMFVSPRVLPDVAGFMGAVADAQECLVGVFDQAAVDRRSWWSGRAIARR